MDKPEGVQYCPHVAPLPPLSAQIVSVIAEGTERRTLQCHQCGEKLRHLLWLCAQAHSEHCIFINLNSFAVLCTVCKHELPESEAAFPAETARIRNLRSILQSAVTKAQANGIKKERPNKRITPTIGLANLGNTCYLNSVLQCLANCRPLSRFFRKCSGAWRPKNSTLVQSFAALASQLHSSLAPALSPAAFEQLPQFRGFTQQDAQEFLRQLLDLLHENLKEELPRDGTDQATSVRKNFTSIISQTFGLVFCSSVTCLACKKVSLTRDLAFDVSLPIPTIPPEKVGWMAWVGESLGVYAPPFQLEECLETFVTPEQLNGDNRFFCDHCKTKNDAEKRITFAQLPEVLVLHIKRFRYDSIWSSKLSNMIKFPISPLELAPYCSPPSPPANPAVTGSTRYRCVGIVRHIGGMGGGHYVSYLRHRKSGRWFECDDQYITEVPEPRIGSLEAYVLFYERIADKPAQIKRIRHSPEAEQVYILAEAWNQLVTMSQPTGVPNPYLCPHGSSLLSASEMRDRVITIPAASLQELQSVCPVVPMPTLQKCPKCEEALSALRKRREEEAATVRALDQRWKYFLDERHAGLVQPPGPVSNSDLLLPDNFTPRSGLQKQTHYRGIVKDVWEFFMKSYGGGPAIIRRSIDLYEDLDANRLRPRRRNNDESSSNSTMSTSGTSPLASST